MAKKLLQINVGVNRGSTGRIVENIGDVVIQEGWESYIAYSRGTPNNKSKSQYLKVGNKFDVFFHVFITRFFDMHGLGSRFATRRLIERIKKIAPSIIQIHIYHGYWLNYPLLFDYLSNCDTPIVWTLHDCTSFTGHCAHFTAVNCNKWKIQCEKCPLIHTYPKSFFIDRSKQNYVKKKHSFSNLKKVQIVPVSFWLEKIVKQSFLSKYPIKFIYNGINTNIFSPRESNIQLLDKYHLPNKTILLACATAWSKNKGLYDYFALSKILPDKYQIVLVGLTCKQQKEIPSNIVGINRTDSQEELADLYSLATIVLNLSLEETFGLTTIEGMSCGTPSIVYNSTASPEIVTKNTGCVVEKGNIIAVQAAIDKICKKGKSYYSNFCRQRVLDNFDKTDRYNDYMVLYEKLV